MTFPYALERLGVIMSPDPGDPNETLGVFNPASGRTPDGRLHLLPRISAAGNVSRVGLAEVVLDNGVPTGVRRRGVVLTPDEEWERSGVEDPRTTWLAPLGLHVMTYVAYGPLGPRPAFAVSADLENWRRIGPMHLEYEPELAHDLNLFPNKDVVVFPEPVRAPDGVRSYAVVHRPMWDLSHFFPGVTAALPRGLTDDRPGIWISFAPADAVERDVRALTHLGQHRLVALPEHPYEELKIGAGPAPRRVAEGWLLLTHGVTGVLEPGVDHQQNVCYTAGAMILDADDVTRIVARTSEPLLAPELPEEKAGTVGNVVFPTAMEDIDGDCYVFYGMADTHIGAARLTQAR